MSRIVYVNGNYVHEEDAKISIFDRGFLFADGVYEVSSVLRGKLIDVEPHLARLRRSLQALEMASPATDKEIKAIQEELIVRNQVEEGMVYLQVTRGVADRTFHYPEGVAPSLVMFTRSYDVIDIPKAKSGISIVTTPDIRWGRRDIKTVGLLAPCMAVMIAKAAGADDAWMFENGYITEGTASNAYIINQEGTLITRHLGTEILHGVTRNIILNLAREENIKIEERPFTVEETYLANEAFFTGATAIVIPVVKIDGKPISDGKPGPVSKRLRKLYFEKILSEIN
ncbi:MAG: D-amino-acid transaminase [SAR324 cluster bacterium]|nr:D-amino-acid transaminase [SAR324 cluster bacterium]